MARRSTAAAYTLIDVSALPDEIRQQVIDDALIGGPDFGVRVVEEAVNGPARSAIFGVYKGEDEERWKEAKKELKISSTEIPDGEVAPSGASVDVDPRREAALRQAAAEQAAAQADNVRTAEDAEVEAITGVAPSLRHTSNIVDDTLDPEATNILGSDGEEPEDIDETGESGGKRKLKTKTPR